MRCPCLSGNPYETCCGPLHAGAPAPTAERLMRSRFTAFAQHNAAYLLASWHPDTRPDELDLDAETTWYRLDVTDRTGGGPFDSTGTVTFTAYFREAGERGALTECSRFDRVDGRWLYRDGDIRPSER